MYNNLSFGVVSMRIAVCDDEAVCRAQLLDIATDYAEERQDKAVVFEYFSDPEALLKETEENGFFDIYILDIVMPGMNGIQLGQALRKSGADGKIIYLTGSQEYALDSFRVRAFDYLLKPIDKTTFYTVLDEAISSINIKKDRVLVIKTRDNNTRVTFDSILYALLDGRSIEYHLVGGKTVESTTLRTTFTEAVSELLQDKRFTLCGAGLAVNMHHVTAVESEGVVFTENERVLLGKKACRELRLKWSNYWINEEG